MFSTIFTIPAGALGTTTAYIGDLITDAGPFVYLALGLPLAFWTVKKLIGLVPGKR